MNHSRDHLLQFRIHGPLILAGLLVILPLIFFTGCKKGPKQQAAPQAQVSVMTITPGDTPVVWEFVGQTQGSHQVEIRARVNGFLDRRVYTEGMTVKKGQTMFLMDPKPFQAQVDAAEGALAQQQARLRTAQAELKRVKPLVEQDALSQKDLDDATGQEQAAAAAVETAKAQAQEARLNLSYTTISSPIEGLSSYARVQEGSYINAQNSLLTYVVRTNPIWVNFSLSENDVLRYRGQIEKGQVRPPKGEAYEVELVLADGSTFPKKGRITFADAEFNQQTGTFLLRAALPNPGDLLRPGMFVRARVHGALYPKAITVPQRVVQQGAKGHFVWVVNNEGKAEARPVVVGDWIGNNWFITSGLFAGDKVVVDGGMTLRPGDSVRVKGDAPSAGPSAAKPDAGKNAASPAGK